MSYMCVVDLSFFLCVRWGCGKVGILLELWGECDNFVLILRI